MKIIKKIRRFSAEYRKHEKEMAELDLKQTIEVIKLAMGASATAVQLASIAASKPSKLADGGVIVPINGDDNEDNN